MNLSCHQQEKQFNLDLSLVKEEKILVIALESEDTKADHQCY